MCSSSAEDTTNSPSEEKSIEFREAVCGERKWEKCQPIAIATNTSAFASTYIIAEHFAHAHGLNGSEIARHAHRRWTD
jgi:hypothetical protein